MTKIKNIFGTGTMRSGGSLTSQIFSLNNKVQMFMETFYFFRHIFKQFKNLQKLSTRYLIANEMSLRVKYRKNLNIDPNLILYNLIRDNVRDYSTLYHSLGNSFLQSFGNKQIFGEYTNGEWRKIETFLNFDKHNIAFQIIRDPRAIISSSKKILFTKNFSYLNVIFNWADAIYHYKKFSKNFNKSRFLPLKFEDLHLNPKMNIKKICDFTEVNFEKKYLDDSYWKKNLSAQYNYINFSAYSKKRQSGFSKKHLNNWKKNLLSWEITIIEYLLKDLMDEFNYKRISNLKLSEIKKGLNKINSNKILKKRLKSFLNTKKGTDGRMNNPKNPENWSSSKDPFKKFILDNDYESFCLENKRIKTISRKL